MTVCVTMVTVIGRRSYTAEVVLCSIKAFGEGSDFTQSDGPKTGQQNVIYTR